MKKMCKECPYKIKSQNNTKLLEFVKKTDKPHSCHMKNSKLWTGITDKNICAGYLSQQL